MEKIKVFELDFGDTNLLSPKIEEIIGWIETDLHDLQSDDELNYTITIKMMTQEEIDALPEWN